MNTAYVIFQEYFKKCFLISFESLSGKVATQKEGFWNFFNEGYKQGKEDGRWCYKDMRAAQEKNKLLAKQLEYYKRGLDIAVWNSGNGYSDPEWLVKVKQLRVKAEGVIDE